MFDRRRVREFLAGWLARVDVALLVGVLLIVAGTWVFLEIADEVAEGDTHEMDRRILLAVRDPADPARLLGPAWLQESVRDVTALGGFPVVLLVTLAVGGYLLIARKYHAFVLVVAATAGGGLISTLLKGLFDRPRPDLVPHLMQVHSASFPSGHSMQSAVVYLTLGTLLARLSPQKRLKIYFIAVALVLAFLVGASRVYLGVHYPTDVLAGWAAGLVWAVACSLVARRLQREGYVEPTMDPGGGARPGEGQD